jgi:WD40 repeat protein
MMRRVLAALALGLLLIPLAQAASSGARGAITVDGGVNEVAMATGGRFAAASADPEGLPLGDPDIPTVNLWNLDGSLRMAASADLVEDGECPHGDAPTDDCVTHATAIAISGNGQRLAVASDRTMNEDVLSCFGDTGTLLGQVRVTGQITDVAINNDGTRVAVVFGFSPGTGLPDDGRLQVYDGECKNPLFTPAAGVIYTGGIARRASFSPDGSYLAVAADAHYYYKLPGTSHVRHAISGADPLDVDVSSTSGWSVAGFDNGFFGVYNNQVTSGLPVEYQKKEPGADGSALNAVAIRPSATAFVTGSNSGTLRYYSLDTGAQSDQVTLVASKTGLGAIHNVAFSGDGHYLAVRSGNDLRLYRTHATGLDELWKDTRANFGPSVAIDQRGEHVVAHAGSSVLVYDAIHKLTPSLPSQTQESGTTANYTVTYRNDGNRMEDITLTASPPTGVIVQVSPDSFTVVPDASKAVTVKVVLPTTQGPGSVAIPLQHKLSAGVDGTGTSTLTVSVPTKRSLTLEAEGAASLAVQPGGLTNFNAIARNNGNVRETGELTVTGLPEGWTAEVQPEAIDLAPGEAASITVSVTAPAGAAHLAQADLVLRRGSGPSLALTATVGAGFGASLDGPRGLLMEPGVSQLVNYTLRNTGNAPDSFTVKLGNLPTGWQASFLSGLSEQRVDGLEPGQTSVVQATVRPPPGSASTVAVQFTVTATSLGDATKSDNHLVLLSVDEPVESETSTTTDAGEDGDNGIPGVPPVILVAALAALALVARRRAA